MTWNIEQMRTELKTCTVYKYSEKWHDKVDKMSPKQVIAVYNRMRTQKLFY